MLGAALRGIRRQFLKVLGIQGVLDRVNELRHQVERQKDQILAEWTGRIQSTTGDGLGLDRWRIQEYVGLLRYLRRHLYEEAIRAGGLDVPVLKTSSPVAGGHDTLYPWGAKNDNSICLRFNSRLYELLGQKPRLAVLDLGCAGGGFVRSLIDDGHFAVGLEGSPLPRINKLGEWGTIPRHLHNCDITKPFDLAYRSNGERIRFDAVTLWEVMEHIADRDLPGLMGNIERHLAADGVVVCSVSTIDDGDADVGAVYHATVQPREWWLDRFGRLGFQVVDQQVIGRYDWLRGSGNCRLDRCAEDEGIGFHLVLRRAAAARAAA